MTLLKGPDQILGLGILVRINVIWENTDLASILSLQLPLDWEMGYRKFSFIEFTKSY